MFKFKSSSTVVSEGQSKHTQAILFHAIMIDLSFISPNPEYLFKNERRWKNSHVGAPYVRSIFVLNFRRFKPLLNYQHGRLWGSSFFQLGSKTTVTAHLCPPCLSTSRFSFLQWHGLTQTHLPPQNRMAQRHHLSKALVVSLMKNHYSNKGCFRGKGRSFDLEAFWIFDTSLIKDFI